MPPVLAVSEPALRWARLMGCKALVFFSTEDCPLCDKGLVVVRRLAGRYDLQVKKVDIRSDPVLEAKYGERIPVLMRGEEELGWGLLSERAIERKILGGSSRPPSAEGG